MGLRVAVHRKGYRSPLNVFDGVDQLTLVNVAGPDEPSAEAPAARLVAGVAGRSLDGTVADGDLIVVPDVFPDGLLGPMMGGTFVLPLDPFRGWPSGVRAAGVIPLHDRFETKEQYEEFSR